MGTTQEAAYFKICSAFLQHLSPQCLELPFSYLCNLHIISCKPQSTWLPKLSWLVCTPSALLPFHGLSLFHQTMSELFMLLSKPPWLYYSLQCCFFLFSPCSALPPSFIKVLPFQLCMFKPCFAGSSFSKHNHESKLRK